MKIQTVDVWKLVVKDQKHRQKLDIENLAQSILTAGQINPITVKRIPGGYYEVIAGRRRTAALTYIQQELTPEKQVRALVCITNLTELQEELIKIDENIMRQQLKGAEFDEAIARRKEIYEDLNPETKQHKAGGLAKSKGKKSVPFTKDASSKLGVTRKTIERSVARATKASANVKAAREKGELSPSKVDLLVTLSHQEQDLLLPFAKKKDIGEIKSIIAETKKKGVKSVALSLHGTAEEDRRLKPLVRDIKNLSEKISEALKAQLILQGEGKHESLKAIDELGKVVSRFADFQRAGLGYVRAISRREGHARKVIRGRQ